MPSADRRSLGAFGEATAAAYLVRAGYTILARNWRCRLGEIDLVARLGDQVVFVEVRTVRGAGRAIESVTRAKRERLARLAYTYLAATAAAEAPWRIDVIAISVDGSGRAHVEHIPSAVGEE